MGCKSIRGIPQHFIARYPFTHLGGERHCESKVLPKNTTLWPQPGLKPTPLRVEHTAHEATTPSDAWHNVIEMYAQEKHRHKMNVTPLYCTSICTDPQLLRLFIVHILFYKFFSTITQNHCMLFTIEGVQEKDPQWHPIDCKILLANCFSLPCTEKENLTWDQESLRAFFHATRQL